MVIDSNKYKLERERLLLRISQIAKQKQITRKTIAERTGFLPNNVTRMLSGKFPPTLDNFLMLCDAIETNFEEL